MKPRTATRLAWSAWGISVSLTTVGVALLALNHSHESLTTPVLSSLGFLVFPTVGALIASRRPDNAIGWLLCAIGVVAGFLNFTEQYAIYALLTNPGSLPGGMELASVLAWGLYAPIVAATGMLVPLLFPDGRLLSPRWRPVIWFALGFVVLAMASNGLRPTPNEIGPLSLRNPTGLEGAEGLLNALETGVALCLLVALPATVISVVVRFRRSKGTERQQLKWFTYAVVLVVAITTTSDLFPRQQGIVVAISFPLLPIAIGIAMFKHRLYDIDVIINRTLVYVSLTAVLALVYVAGVVGAGGLVRDVTGQENNNLVVAGSTLVVAALFRPARSSIQQFIDRRFYRRRYNAARTIENFSARLRDEVDLEAVRADLLRVVEEAMQPTQVSLWLKT
jgi:hypothetical protein